MTGILNREDTELGYCDQCERPCVPGVFKIKGWHHRFRLCDICLLAFAEEVIKSGTKLMEEFKK